MPSRLKPRTTTSRAVFVESGSLAAGPARHDNLQITCKILQAPFRPLRAVERSVKKKLSRKFDLVVQSLFVDERKIIMASGH